MTHTPPVLTMNAASLEHFLALLPPAIVTRSEDCITVHANAGDAVWHCRNGCWMTAAPGFDTARRFGATGPVQ